MCKLYVEHLFYECGHTGISKAHYLNCECLEIKYRMYCHDGKFCPQCIKSKASKYLVVKDTSEEESKAIEQKICELMKVRRKWRLRGRQFWLGNTGCCGSPDCITALSPKSRKYWPDTTYTNMRFIPADEISEDRCDICWGAFNGDDLCESGGLRLMLPCGHIFGRNSIEHILYGRGRDSYGNNCPLCKVKLFGLHTLPSPASSVFDVIYGEKPTKKPVRWALNLILYLSFPWFFAVIFTMDVGPRHKADTPTFPFWYPVVSGALVAIVFLIAPIIDLLIVILALIWLIAELICWITRLGQEPIEVLQTVTNYTLDLEEKASSREHAEGDQKSIQEETIEE
jgi:hypothetical protein